VRIHKEETMRETMRGGGGDHEEGRRRMSTLNGRMVSVKG
jgi:hypothetical protein